MLPISSDDWWVVAEFMVFPLPLLVIWVYLIDHILFGPLPTLPTLSRDEWEGGFWHHDDGELIDLEKGDAAATDKHRAFNEKDAGWETQGSGWPPNTRPDFLKFC